MSFNQPKKIKVQQMDTQVVQEKIPSSVSSVQPPYSSKNQPRTESKERFRDRERENRVGSHVRVEVHQGEPFEKVIRRFKKACERAGIKKELKARRYYEKPSEARRREIRKKERNRRKAERQNTNPIKQEKRKFNKDNEF